MFGLGALLSSIVATPSGSSYRSKRSKIYGVVMKSEGQTIHRHRNGKRVAVPNKRVEWIDNTRYPGHVLRELRKTHR